MKSSILYCVTSYHYQVISLILFFIGMTGILISKNLIKILISIEFIINSINILFVSFATYKSNINYTGYSVAIFVSVLSALVMAIGLYFTYLINQKFGTINIGELYKCRK